MSNERFQDAINAVVVAGGNKTEAAASLQVPRTTFLGWLEGAALLGLKPTVMAPDVEGRVAELEFGLKNQIKTLESKLKEAISENVTNTEIRKYVFGLSEMTPEPMKWITHNRPGENQPGIPVLMLSDFHWGEVVKLEQVAGLNEFNMKIASKRFKYTIDNTINLCFEHIAHAEYPGIVVLLGGDMVNGNIHEELSLTNEEPIMPVIFDLFTHLVAGLTELMDKFGKVMVFTTFGNHGRTTIKPPYKDAAKTNFDWMLYTMLERHFTVSGEKRITIKVEESFDSYFKIYDTNMLLTHGDRLGTAGGGGVIGVVGPIMRGVQKVKDNYAQLGRPVDMVVMGHWHQYIPMLPSFLVNGCLKGYDEFAMGHRFTPSAPLQSLWMMHPRRGVTISAPIFCEGTSIIKLDKPWVSWEK